jgi:hypothetical protein
MDTKAALELLNDKAATLEETIRDIDYQIERAMHAVAGGTDDVGHAISVLTERHNTQLGLMFDLGKVTAQIEDLENRVQEQDEQGTERQAAQEWQAEVPIEDHLDWLRPALDAPAPQPEPDQDERHPHQEDEERMLAEMQREDREPEDYLDWWKQ